jgi:hypothetical protein
MKQIEAEQMTAEIMAAMKNLGIKTRAHYSRNNSGRNKNEVCATIIGNVPGKSLILSVYVFSLFGQETIYFNANGQIDYNAPANGKIVLRSGRFVNVDDNGIFFAELHDLSDSNRETKVNNGIEWLRQFTNHPSIASHFKNTAVITFDSLIDFASVEYGEMTKHHKETTGKIVCAAILENFPADMFTKRQKKSLALHAERGRAAL